jgi:hypothetical protein
LELKIAAKYEPLLVYLLKDCLLLAVNIFQVIDRSINYLDEESACSNRRE